MAYGDAYGDTTAVPWSEYESMEFMWRLEELLQEWHENFNRANHPERGTPEADAAERRSWERIQETVHEWAVYNGRMDLERKLRGT